MVDQERKLYVQNLPGDISDAELKEVFGIYGPLEEAVVLSNKLADVSVRAAIVKFLNKDEAAAAMAVLNDMYKFREDSAELEPIRISLAREGRPKDHERGSKGSFESATPPPAERGAFNQFDRSRWTQTPTHEQRLPPPAERGAINQFDRSRLPPPAPPPVPAPPSSVFSSKARESGEKLWVGNLPGDISDDELHKVFGRYGKVEDVNILPAKSKSGQLCAFVHFSAAREADDCIAGMAGFKFRPGDAEEVKIQRHSERRKGKDSGKGDSSRGDWVRSDWSRSSFGSSDSRGDPRSDNSWGGRSGGGSRHHPY